jgi:hypothetical protein
MMSWWLLIMRPNIFLGFRAVSSDIRPIPLPRSLAVLFCHVSPPSGTREELITFGIPGFSIQPDSSPGKAPMAWQRCHRG